MSKFIDLTGGTFGEWFVVSRSDKVTSQGARGYWNCKCSCGREAVVLGSALRGKSKNSCKPCSSTTHGLSGTPAHVSWRAMKQRCDNPNDGKFEIYGSRGITYQESWKDFIPFLEDMGERPLGTSIDRIDTNGNYCKENCRWATIQEQRGNQNPRGTFK